MCRQSGTTVSVPAVSPLEPHSERSRIHKIEWGTCTKKGPFTIRPLGALYWPGFGPVSLCMRELPFPHDLQPRGSRINS